MTIQVCCIVGNLPDHAAGGVAGEVFLIAAGNKRVAEAVKVHDAQIIITNIQRSEQFAESDLDVSLFVMAGHSYELEALDHWEYMEDLLKLVRSYGFETMTTMEFVDEFYYGR